MKSLSQIRDEVYTLINASDNDKKRYEKSIIHAVNYALVELSGEVSPIVEHKKVSIFSEENLYGDIALPITVKGGRRSFRQEKVGSIAIRYIGRGLLRIIRGGIPEEFPLEYSSEERVFTHTFDKAQYILPMIISDSKIMITSFGMFLSTSDAKCPEEYVIFDLDEMTEGKFMRFSSKDPVVDTFTDEVPSGVVFRNSHTVALKNKNGVYEISYLKYPTLLEENAPANTPIEIGQDALNLMPLLCAWRLLKEDDERLAGMYFNEYSAAKENLILLGRINSISDVRIDGGVL